MTGLSLFTHPGHQLFLLGSTVIYLMRSWIPRWMGMGQEWLACILIWLHFKRDVLLHIYQLLVVVDGPVPVISYDL